MSQVTSGNNNPMFGISYYDCWVVKYGKEEADKKLVELKQKLSLVLSGEKNPMYGKIPPKGTGAGWSGWYKNWFFRSLRELAYMINVIEKNKYQWITGEKTSIPYKDYEGKNRTYRPDFILENKIMVEIKPLKLMSTPNNVLKKIAGEKYCLDNGLEYRMVDIAVIKKKEIQKLINNGLLILTDKYKAKLLEKYED